MKNGAIRATFERALVPRSFCGCFIATAARAAQSFRHAVRHHDDQQ